MKTTLGSTSKTNLILSAGALLVLAACSDGGPAPTLLSGAVIDGYIEGAIVCLDTNSNGACDAGEPSDTSKAGGKYALDITGINTSGLTVVADIPSTAKDSDDGGQTLAAAGKSAYTMMTMADKPAVITPLTTQAVGKVRDGNMTLAQASTLVIQTLGLPATTDLHEDHMAKGNTAVRTAARSVASQLQQQRADLGSIAQTSVSPLNMPTGLSQLATGQLIAYKMTGAKGQPINATAMIFKPKSSAPAGGWPLVVFGHGTDGVGQQCAPSVTMNATGQWGYADLVASLVAQGIVVIAPDYEGLGSADMGVAAGHPYLNLRSAGQSMALAAVAAKKNLSSQLSGSWATFGHSQGGHAALAGAQFAGLAKQLAPGLTYKGALAVAPASNFLNTLNITTALSSNATPASYLEAYSAVGTVSGYTAYVVNGSASTAYPIAPSSVLGSRMLNLYNTAVTSTCREQFTNLVAADIYSYSASVGATPQNYPGVIATAVNTLAVGSILAANEPGQVTLPGKTMIVQGNADTTVLPSITTSLVNTMKSKGTDVTLSAYDNTATVAATHSGVLALPAAQAAMGQFLASLFSLTASGASTPAN